MKLLVAGHDLKFIQFYLDYLNDERKDIEVKIDKWESHTSHNQKISFELLDWADVIFCEWGLGNSIFYSNNKRKHQRLIVRIHRQELETNYLFDANIEKIDYFITVSPYIYEEFSRTFSLPRQKMKLIFNPVDIEKFTNKNNDDRKYNIGMVGYLPVLKRMDLALDIMELLYEQDNKYQLFFKGKKPQELDWLWRNEEMRSYYEKQFDRINRSSFKDNVHIEEFGDVSEFYNNMEFILSISDVESFHLAAAEGMACGAFPIIMNWEGSNTIYPEKYILDGINDIPGYIKKVRANESSDELVEYIKRYNMRDVINKLDVIINKVEEI